MGNNNLKKKSVQSSESSMVMSMFNAHKKMMGQINVYEGLDDNPAPKFEVDDTEIKEFTYYDEDDVSYDSEDDEIPCLISDAQKATLKEWLADVSNWKKMKGLGRGFEGGASFVPCQPDGNCMFNAI